MHTNQRLLNSTVPPQRPASGTARLCALALVWLLGAAAALAQPDYPPAIWNQAYPDHWYTTGYARAFCVIHDMEGYYLATISYFQQASTDASIHYCVNGLQDSPSDHPAGEITQMVRENYWAWHVRCWNRYMFGTEHEGFVSNPAWFTEEMYQASAALQRHLCDTWGIPKDRNHIVGHNEWQNPAWTAWMATNWPAIDTTCNDHTDPGPFWDWTHFMELINPPVPPGIAQQPQDQSVLTGQDAAFSVNATGTPPLSFQWSFQGNPIADATNLSLTVHSAQLGSAGTYSVLITNAYGSITSSNAMLTVHTLAAYGDDTFGQTDPPPPPVTNAVAVAAGASHSLALRADGTVLAWGDNFSGQCNVPTNLNDALAIAAGGYHSLAVRANGTLAAWGANDYGQATAPVGLTAVLGVAGGAWHSLALRKDGTVLAWGDNTAGQTNVPVGLTNVIAVAAAGNHSLALKADGTVVGWGENTDASGTFVGESVVPQDLSNVVAIAAGDHHSLAVRADGTVVAWGDNAQGQCSVPPDLAGVVAVAGGGAHSLALKANGTVIAWGANWNGQCDLAPVTNAVAIATGRADSLLLVEGIPLPASVRSPAWAGGRFEAVVETFSRYHYALEFKDTLSASNWSALPAVAGNGGLRLMRDPAATPPQRFYRVGRW